MTWAPKNIRSRLALGFAIAVAVTVVIYAGVVYAFTRATLLEQLDERLHDDFERAERAFEIAADGSLSWVEAERPPHGDPPPEAPWTEVAHPQGGPGLRRPAKADTRAGPSRVHEQDMIIGGEAYRVRVGRSLDPLHAELRALLGLLGLCFVPVVGLAWLGGLVLARRALRPVDTMTERARHIGAEQLSARLPVAHADDELGRLAMVFNDAFERIEGSFERLQRFTSDAAHELRTPLAALRTVGEVGLRRPPDAQVSGDVIASMLEETARLTRLVEELLELSRGDARSTPVKTESVQFVALAHAVCDQLEALASERGQTLLVEGDTEVVVSADPIALRRAVTNLVDNAIRHGPSSAPIQVRVRSDGAKAVLTVKDEGPGISPEHRQRIFDRFFRVDPARAGAGTGLGLALAAQAIELQGGRLTLESDPAGGNTFRMAIPLRGVPGA